MASTRTGTPTDGNASTVYVLGPVGVRHDGVLTVPRSRQQRAILGALALAGRAVSEDWLVDVVWGAGGASRSSVAVALHRLRKWLAGLVGDRIAVRYDGNGYRLATQEPTDAEQFTELCAAADGLPPAQRIAPLGQALRLWRGQPLTGLTVGHGVDDVVHALAERHRTATVRHGEGLVAVGRAADAVESLSGLASRYPLDEPVQGGLMQALAACGRQAEALAVYEQVRLRLSEELGVVPSRALSDALVRVLRQEIDSPNDEPAPPTADAPAQLPLDVAGFTGRAEQVDQLAALRANAGGAMVISAVAGAGGVGKTALAVHWAHRITADFPDGQLYQDLRGYSAQEPVRPIDALGRLLRSLGAQAGEVPADLDEAAAAYRTRLAGRRVLVLLDNASGAAQVRPLLPASPGCLVLITSRDRLDGLVVGQGARRIDLDVLRPDEAIALLGAELGAERVAHEQDAVADLAELCGYLPLALRIVAANLLGRPGSTVAEQVTALRGDLLGQLTVAGEPELSVRAEFDLSYLRLGEFDRRLFRLLGVAPGTDITAPAAAALCGGQPAETEAALGRLLAAHLLTSAVAGRYGMHDLVSSYARERAAADEPAADVQAALRELRRWYVAMADAAARQANPSGVRLPARLYPDPQELPADFDPMEFFGAELTNLIAIAEQAADGPDPEVSWLLSDALGWFVIRTQPARVLRTVAEISLRCAEAQDDLNGRIAALRNLAYSHRDSDPVESARNFRAAADLAKQTDWTDGAVAAAAELGAIALVIGDLDEAIVLCADALAASTRAGHLRSTLANTYNLAGAHWMRGDLAEALELFERAAADSADLPGAPDTLGMIAFVQSELGRTGAAVATAERAYRELLPSGDRWVSALMLCSVVDVFAAAGRLADARRHGEELLAVSEQLASTHRLADAHRALGGVALRAGDFAAARSHFDEAVALGRAADYPLGEIPGLVGLGTACHRLRRDADAAQHLQRALVLADNAGYRLIEADACLLLADVHQVRGHLDWAATHAERARSIAADSGAGPRLVRALLALGAIAAASGRHDAATEHRRACLAMAADLDAPEADLARRLLSGADTG